MRRRSIFPGLPAAALLGLLLLLAGRPAARAQQAPIYGCRHAISCRNSPLAFSALNDPGVGGLLVSGSVRWGPGFDFGLKMPLLKPPAAEREPEAAVDLHAFHLRDVTLLPPLDPDQPSGTPSPTPPTGTTPTPTPTPTTSIPFSQPPPR
jgi:hypothetical protein